MPSDNEVVLNLNTRDFASSTQSWSFMSSTLRLRPTCVLVIGNGFSSSAIQHLGLSDRIITNPLIPLPDHVEYVPFARDGLSRGPIRSKERFPILWERWHLHKPNLPPSDRFYSFCTELAEEVQLWCKSPGALGMRTLKNAGTEMRGYLWYLFTYYDSLVRETMKGEGLLGWSWLEVLYWFCQRTRLILVSFNYDCIAELALFGHLRADIISPLVGCCDALAKMPVESTLVLKPHGSISFSSAMGGITPWLGGTEDVSHVGCQLSRFEYPPRSCPLLPDLVPPGHSESHYVSYDSDVQRAVAAAFSEAECVIFCGLSARAPDTNEVEGYLKRLQRDTPAIHIDFTSDTPAGSLLRQHAAEYSYLTPAELARLPERFISIIR